MLRIATAADFCGTRWTANAVILGTHPERTFLMQPQPFDLDPDARLELPAASVTSLQVTLA